MSRTLSDGLRVSISCVPLASRFARRGLPRLGWAAASLLLICCGCNRTWYRTQADAEVYDVVGYATVNPRFEIPDYTIEIDPRSRLYDPTDPDRPPMPPDDPESHRFMEYVDGHRGWRHWEKDGVLSDVEVSDYDACLPYAEDGKIRIDHVGAVELARLHSRDYQQQLETLYLSALDVTAERFRFDCQYFAGNATFFDTFGRIRNGGESSSTLTTVTGGEVRRLTTTGGTFLVGLANTILWQFAGPNTSSNTSLANFAISQPLLQFAGKPRIMETLTRSERILLANVRQYDRYQQGFYLDITLGAGGAGGVQRAGGLFGGSGLASGFTGVGVGGFGNVGAAGVQASNSAAGGGGAGANNLGGYFGFLQQQQFIRLNKARLARLRDAWQQLEASFDAGRLDNRFQVDQARQEYYFSLSVLLNLQAGYETALDAYKMRLGLPPHLPFDLADPFFNHLDLVDTELTALQSDVLDRIEQISDTQITGAEIDRRSAAAAFIHRAQHHLGALQQDLARLDAALPARRESLTRLAQAPEVIESRVDLRALSLEVLDAQANELHDEFDRLIESLENLTALAQKLADEPLEEPELQLRAEKETLTQLSAALLNLSLLQARSRLHSITLVPIDVTPEIAFQIALTQRADWMNAKASLVDAWRLIRFNANALRSNLTIDVFGDIGTTGNNPLNFRGANSRLSAGFTFDLPLTRLIERNQFRQSLIEYQQSRRSLMAQRDEIERGLRSRLRQIRLDQFNLELRRLGVDTAITQTDVARLKLIEPEKPLADGKAAPTSPTVARDLIDALQQLQNTQQQLIQVWGDYEAQRRQLDFELGTMQLDIRGIWCDPGPMTDESLQFRCFAVLSDPFLEADAAELAPPAPEPAEAELAPGELPPDGEGVERELLAPPLPEE